ncbi:hypothetical protein LG204_05780 [Methylovorus menthalis]|uniref:hypothetical protein n=1 Tax=Methylovorus menthalis TaxID=1002227 RepID=UPI001E54015F|nr:hypothetical protein [Methylovorus menthalis]MCB4810820.1 hypothetical protein [Methylovorus menthalis]
MSENPVRKGDPNNKLGWRWHIIVVGSFFFSILAFVGALFFLIDPEWAYELMHISPVGSGKELGK